MHREELKPVLIELTARKVDEIKSILDKPVASTGDADQLSLL